MVGAPGTRRAAQAVADSRRLGASERRRALPARDPSRVARFTTLVARVRACAGSRTRTGTPLRERDFKSLASARFAIPAALHAYRGERREAEHAEENLWLSLRPLPLCV